MLTRDFCIELDRRDPLAPLREAFALDASDSRGLIYLDGNSLGVLPRRTLPRVQHVVAKEWGEDLIASWNTAGWITLASQVGDKIARLIGAHRSEVIVGDSTSINLFKALRAAVSVVQRDGQGRRRLLSERSNFPSDLYIAETLARDGGLELVLVDEAELMSMLDTRVAVLMLTQVNYRTGYMHDLAALTDAAHRAGALTVWDLSHSAGAVPLSLNAADADFAVGCGYKYLNGGPGAPAFIWAHARMTARLERDDWRSPLSGWLGHAAPFAFSTPYRPGPGMMRFVCGTPPILSLAALECGVDVLLEAEALGGMVSLREKSVRLTTLFVDLVEARCARHDLALLTPRDPALRGSQVCFAHPAAYPMMQALIARGVVGDFRAPDIMRFGFPPAYTRFTDVWDAVDRLVTVLDTEEWRDSRFALARAVT